VQAAAVNYAINVWAMKRVMSVARSQVSELITSTAKVQANLEPHKGTLLDVRL
jgi:hypothetical protein